MTRFLIALCALSYHALVSTRSRPRHSHPPATRAVPRKRLHRRLYRCNTAEMQIMKINLAAILVTHVLALAPSAAFACGPLTLVSIGQNEYGYITKPGCYHLGKSTQ